MKKPIPCGIYKILNTVNNKFYIGKSRSIKTRFNAHRSALRNNKHHSFHLQRAWNKYGEDKFKFIILELCNECDLLKKEDEYLLKLKPFIRKNGYNIDIDGKRRNEETKKKLVLTKSTQAFKIKMSAALRKTWDSYKKKVNQFSINGEFITSYESITDAANRYCTEKKQIINACKRKSLTCKGFIWRYDGDTDVTNKRDRSMRTIISTDINGLETEYESAIFASKIIGCDPSAINKCCRGISNSSMGLKWRFKYGR